MPTLTPVIELHDSDGLGLIIQHPSGVRYTNQVAGFGCEHPELEGVFVPLFDGVGKPAIHALKQHFRGGWHELGENDADIIDAILKRARLGFIKADLEKLPESREAWVWVVIEDGTNGHFGPIITGFGSCNGVVTWQNSD